MTNREAEAGQPLDPYKALQVDPEADPEVIQAAYRRLARKWHPDVAVGPDAAARMARLNRAWEIVGDPERRREYDRIRAAVDRGAASASERTADGAGSVGPPPGNASGSVLNFGRYAGWSLGEIGRADLEYVEWLDRTPIGRPYREEIDAILRRTGRRRTAAAEAAQRRGLFRRR
ncbi:MAG: DnaJ domain-containing protein [Chloroflexi bacterium]|nr:DnaJ domain-containing protein [Chloroflexota bacterium]